MKKYILLALLAASFQAKASTYDLLLQGKKCQEGYDQQMDCEYTIGQDFWLSIAGVGGSDTGIVFMKSDFHGMYYGSIGVQHGCVIVKVGTANKSATFSDLLAFVSPKNGKIYKDWQSCKAGH